MLVALPTAGTATATNVDGEGDGGDDGDGERGAGDGSSDGDGDGDGSGCDSGPSTNSSFDQRGIILEHWIRPSHSRALSRLRRAPDEKHTHEAHRNRTDS